MQMKTTLTQLLSTKTAIMGIVNVTPDSFSDGGKYQQYDAAMQHIESLILAGADLIDIGAESTRPGSKAITAAEEIDRLHAVVSAFKFKFDVMLSIDTKKAAVADVMLDLGADVINDVSGATSLEMQEVIKKHQAAVIIMHMQQTPATMQDNPEYSDVVADIKGFFDKQIRALKQKGITDIVIDPGIGFGKTLEHNIALLKQLSDFKSLNKPILVGTSKKSFISAITNEPANERFEGSVISNFLALQKGANMIRVHDVSSAKKIVQLYKAFKE